MEFISSTPAFKIEACTVPEFVLRKCTEHARNGRSEYLIDGITDKKRYFQNLDSESKKFASHLHKQGFRKGDFAMYSLSSQYHQVVIMMGVWRANGILRSMYIEEDAETVIEKIKECNIRWVFCQTSSTEFYKEIEKSLPWKLTIIVVGDDVSVVSGTISIDEYYNDSGDQCPPFDLTPDDIAFIFPSSGTTGPSKGVIHSHRSIAAVLQLWQRFPFSLEQPNLIASKGTHMSGALMPYSVLAKGGTGIVLPTIDKYIIIRTVDKFKPYFAFAFPSFLLALASPDAKGYDVSSLKVVLTGGSQVTKEMRQGFYRIPNVSCIVILYGLTEVAVVSCSYDLCNCRPTFPDMPDTSVGRAYPGVEIKIVDMDTLKTLPPNKEGEICARCEFGFQGYFKSPEKTKATHLNGNWVRTGDIGYLDENGFLFVVDRAKEIFKYYHDHISPTDVEIVISQHPLVKEVCVVPVEDEGGHVPRAFISLLNPTNDLERTRKEILEYANGKLPNYKRLRGGLYVITEFPKGKTGKVTRNLVAKLEPPEDQL